VALESDNGDEDIRRSNSRSPTPKRESDSEDELEDNAKATCKYYPIEQLNVDIFRSPKRQPTVEEMAFLKEDFYRTCGPSTLEFFQLYEGLWETETENENFFGQNMAPLVIPSTEENSQQRVVLNAQLRGLLENLNQLQNLVIIPSQINLSTVYDLMTKIGLKAKDLIGEKSKVYNLV
jgi:hypothetical protein